MPEGDVSISAVVRTPNPNGQRIVVRATFTEHGPRAGRMTDIYHDPITETYTEVSFQGEVFDKGERESCAFGQVSGYLPTDHPLRLLWERWHLNATRSHCAHQDRAVRWDEVPPCASGYRCGTAWLIEPLPLDVTRQIISLMTTTITPNRREAT